MSKLAADDYEFEFDINRFDEYQRRAFRARLDSDGPEAMRSFWGLLQGAAESARESGVDRDEIEARLIGELYDSQGYRDMGPVLRHQAIIVATALVRQAIEKRERLSP